MSSSLRGIELLDCAQSNYSQGIEVAADRCGYGNALESFEEELRRAARVIGISIQGFDDLITLSRANSKSGVNIAPESHSQI